MQMEDHQLFLSNARNLADPVSLELNKDTLTWVLSLSLKKSNVGADGSTLVENKSGSGHNYENVNDSMGAQVMLALFFLTGATIYMCFRVYMKQKYLTESWLKEHGKKPAAGQNFQSEDQISREIPKELNESNAGRGGMATDVYAQNVNSKRELVPQTEKKLNKNNELATKDKSAKSQKVPESKPVDANEIQF